MKKSKILIVIVVLVIIVIVGGSYAYLRVERKGSNQNISIANFGLVIKEDMKPITLDNEVPKSDEEGLKNSPNTFIIKNEGDVAAKYQVSLIDTTPASTMSNLDIRYRLKRTRSTASSNPETLEIKNLELNGLLDEGVIAPSEEITYELIIWIDYDANPNGLTFKKVLSLEGFQADTQDTSGANPPEMLPNMIPVYYDKTSDTDGVWKVADVTNRDTNSKWYDYNDFMWANAVTVKETNGTLNEDETMTFDGVDDYYDLGHADYDFGNTISLIIRFKLNSYGSQDDGYKDLLGNLMHDNHGGGGMLRIIGKNFNFGFYDKNNSGETINAISTDECTLNTWYTIIGTYDGNIANLYINGEKKVSIEAKDKVYVKSNKNFLIAKRSSDGSCVAPITVSDAFVYTDALTEEEVSKYFSGEITDYPKDNLLIEKTEFNELDTRQKYLEASVGTEVKMDDITSMWVWIPRYKYTIFNGNNETSEEQMINVEFERGIETTGTVSCQDEISTDANATSSEICTDKTNNGIVNGVSTYTHPAFTFGSEELVGFWFAKFEISTDDSTCSNTNNTNGATNCNKKGMNILIKPDQLPYRYVDNSTYFANARNMEIYGNIHGFPQSEKATSYLDANGNLSGDIKDDNNNYDIHMIKNMEWGAVAYLTMSKYGKYGNSLYQNENKEVYQNNYYKFENNIYTYKTGYSGKIVDAVASTSGALYNNLTIEVEGQGYVGAGASTTGTIYGVYDMAGGISEKTMSNKVDSSGNFQVANAGTWDGTNLPLSKYYDKYSNREINQQTQTDIVKEAITIGKLGDASREVMKTYGIRNGTWYDDQSHSSFAWYAKGGGANGRTDSGIFYFFNVNAGAQTADAYHVGSRVALTISRDFPWKD